MRSITLFLAAILAPLQALAAGFIDHQEDGTPYRWKTFPISYEIDQPTACIGALPCVPPPTCGTPKTFGCLVDEAFAAWQGVSVASMSFANGGDLGVDVTADNVESYIVFEGSAPRNVTNDTIIIFDEDGGIMERFFGSGASNKVLGLASPGKFDEPTAAITQGLSIMNGKNADATDLLATMTHEFGHMFNLAHTQLNFEEYATASLSDDQYIPTMFPILPSDPVVMTTLQLEDAFSLGMLYPKEPELGAKGRLSGKILRRTGEAVRAVNVICRNEASPRLNAVSWVSDAYLAGTGEYVCGNLPDGSYSIFIEPIELAINGYDPDPPFIAPEYYNAENESFDPEVDDRTESKSVTVNGGAPVEDINITVNEDGRLFSGIEVASRSAGFFPTLEYFITVPPGAKSVRFDLQTEASIDLDLLGRCEFEFSLVDSPIALPLTSDGGSAQQADFATTSTSGNETVTLDSDSSPALEACTYHLLVVNYDATTDDFTLKATIDGKPGLLRMQKGADIADAQGTGEVPVFAKALTAERDTLRLRKLTLTDEGTGDLSGVTQASLYVDSDRSGTVTDGDVVLGTAAVDASARTATFSGMDRFLDIDSTTSILVTYTIPSEATAWLFLLFSPLLGWVVRRKRGAAFMLIFLSVALSSCGSGTKAGFHPTIRSSDDITITGVSFGPAVSIRDEENLNSVAEFFE